MVLKGSSQRRSLVYSPLKEKIGGPMFRNFISDIVLSFNNEYFSPSEVVYNKPSDNAIEVVSIYAIIS